MTATSVYAAHKKWGYLVLLCACYALTLFILNKGWALDESISGMFFKSPCHAENARACWLLDKSDQQLTFLIHHLPVHIFTAVGVVALVIILAGIKNKKFTPYRQLCVLVLIGLTAVPGIVALLKITTGHHCPGQLAMYGGPIGTSAKYQPKPVCFPAGFPAGGFGFIVLYFGALPQLWKRLGLYAGLGLGGVSSVIQIARGEHFFSHCLGTLATALFVGMIIHMFKDKFLGLIRCQDIRNAYVSLAAAEN